MTGGAAYGRGGKGAEGGGVRGGGGKGGWSEHGGSATPWGRGAWSQQGGKGGGKGGGKQGSVWGKGRHHGHGHSHSHGHSHGHSHSGGKAGGRGGYSGTGLDGARVNKEKQHQFVVANYRLMLEPSADPLREWGIDEVAPWGSICEACQISDEAFECPICLEDPAAARITPCGHFYCLPCLLNWMRVGNKGEGPLHLKSKVRCPECNMETTLGDMKPLTRQPIYKLREENIRETFLCIARRDTKMSCSILANDEAAEGASNRFNVYATATGEELKEAVARELDEIGARLAQTAAKHRGVLSAQMEEGDDVITSCYAAHEFLSEHLADLKALYPSRPSRRRMEQQEAISSSSSCPSPVSPGASRGIGGASGTRASKNVYQGRCKRDVVTFYQISDGRPIFVNPDHGTRIFENSKLLTLKSLPLLKLRAQTQTEETRRKYPTLGHLPLHSNFYIADVDVDKAVERGVLERAAFATPEAKPLMHAEPDSEDEQAAEPAPLPIETHPAPTHAEDVAAGSEACVRRSVLEMRGGQRRAHAPRHAAPPPSPPLTNFNHSDSCEQALQLLAEMDIDRGRAHDVLQPLTIQDVAASVNGDVHALVDHVLNKISSAPAPPPPQAVPDVLQEHLPPAHYQHDLSEFLVHPKARGKRNRGGKKKM